MLCILTAGESDQELCMEKQCRYYINELCVLTRIDRDGWPGKDCRAKNEHVQGKKELKEMSIHGPGCCSD